MKLYASILYLLLILAGIGGWVNNIILLCKADFEPSYKNEVIRTVGIFIAPVGAIVGFIELED